MRNVRIFYKKYSRMSFVSHLDTSRLMIRLIRMTDIPIWYTEGFNQHPYVTFALPLSLGFYSDYEIMDIKVEDDNYTNDMVFSALEKVFPYGLTVIKVTDRGQKAGEIAFAQFKISFESNDKSFADKLNGFLSQESIITEKRTKKGGLKNIDITPHIKVFSIETTDKTVLKITLSAGGETNINPTLLLSAFGEVPYYKICRTALLDKNGKLFE